MGTAPSSAMLDRIEKAVPRGSAVSPKQVADKIGASLRTVRDGLAILYKEGRVGKIAKRAGSNDPNTYERAVVGDLRRGPC